MWSYGMFVDGVTYASIARNMAENHGSFWQPYYTETVYPSFYEHPPLGFWLQSWVYRLCGDSVYVEAWWGFCVGTLILLGLAGIWRCLAPQNYALAGAWFPIMLFIVTPMTSWAFANNMLENTMTFFILLSVLLCLLSLKNSTTFFSFLYGILSGLSIFCSILIKGPVTLFPLAVPLIAMMHDAEKTIKISITAIILLMTLMVSFGLMLATNTASVHFFKRYVSQQVLASITGKPETSASRFDVLTVVSRESLVPLLVGGTLAATIYRLRQPTISSIHCRLFLYYLGIALTGSLPILVSMKQRRWYAFPSFPFYAMAIAVIFNDSALALERWVYRNKNIGKNIIISSFIILCIALSAMFAEKNTPRRDKDFYADFSEQNRPVGEGKVISVYPIQLATNWTLVANMQRKFRVSLSEHLGKEYLLTTTDYIDSEYISSHYKRIPPFNTKKYAFFKLND